MHKIVSTCLLQGSSLYCQSTNQAKDVARQAAREKAKEEICGIKDTESIVLSV